MSGYFAGTVRVIGTMTCLWFWLFAVTHAQAGPMAEPHTHLSDAERALHDAEHRVDEAWEVYHEAALGGTLASPAVQAQVEQDLHEARRLLVEARDLARRGDLEAMEPILDRIGVLADNAIKGSRERKR